jgi:hypothetical protein
MSPNGRGGGPAENFDFGAGVLSGRISGVRPY